MRDAEMFALALLLGATAALAAVLSNRLSERLRVPAPALFLVGAALASDLWPGLRAVPLTTVQNVVTVALVVILFDGGMHLGWQRVRSKAGVTLWVGVAGTLLTAVGVAVSAHLLVRFDWRTSLLLGTALAPTDPAVVFSVLGRRQITGSAGVVLQGESGANDPVGIALLVALLAATGNFWDATGHIAWQFALQMGVGMVVGIAGGGALLMLMQQVRPLSAGLYPLQVLAGALVIYAAATLAHGSGFLAVLIAGLMVGDRSAPYKHEITVFHTSLASLAEVVSFVMLGLTVSVRDLFVGGAWWTGLMLAVLLTFVIRPLVILMLTRRTTLRCGERWFAAWTGLKGAVPILLGVLIMQSGIAGAHRTYEVIFVVVTFSVLIQGGMVPTVARICDVGLRRLQLMPWSVSVRFENRPDELHHYAVVAGSNADGTAVCDLPFDDGTTRISMIIRRGALLPVRATTRLAAEDEVLIHAQSQDASALTELFNQTAPAVPTDAAAATDNKRMRHRRRL